MFSESEVSVDRGRSTPLSNVNYLTETSLEVSEESGSSVLDRALTAAFNEIVSLPVGDEKDHRIDDFLSDMTPVAKSISSRLFYCRDMGTATEEDLYALCMEEAYLMLIGEVRVDMPVKNWPGMLNTCVSHSANRMLDPERNSGLSGLSGRNRRVRAYMNAKKNFVAQNGYEPEEADMIAYYNDHVARNRSNPVKQGAYVTSEDLNPVTIGDLDSASHIPSDHHSSTLDRLEGNELVSKTITACFELGEDLGYVAEAFLGSHLSEPGYIEERIIYISKYAGVSRLRAADLVEQVRQVAQGILAEMLS